MAEDCYRNSTLIPPSFSLTLESKSFFLATRQVGETGRVIGVDMTPEMISKARNNAINGNYHNVEFRLGEIEHLPVADATVDVILSNCVINLSPDKLRLFMRRCVCSSQGAV